MREKQLTRRRLAEAALTLFATQGYEETTISQIAAAAGVSVRSFFKHFGAKAEAIVDFGPADLDALVNMVVEVPDGLSDAEALQKALGAWFMRRSDSASQRWVITLLVMASAESVVIRGAVNDHLDMCVGAAAIGLSRRRGEEEPSIGTRLLAASILRMHQMIVREWAASSEDDFAIFSERYYREVNRAFSPVDRA
jgi:AcrR family transcriptional regulator